MSRVNATFICLLAACLLFVQPLQAQDLECDDAVALRSGRITVAANGVDDTETIQCALDEAKRLRIPFVRLVSDVYYISNIQIEDFNGTLEGIGRDKTTVIVLNDSIDCARMGRNNQFPAAIKFINGNVELRWMTIGAETPCSRPWSPPSIVLVHFTGSTNFSGCNSGTGNGSVDRTNLVSVSPSWPESGQFLHGVDASPDVSWSGTCRVIQSGALRVQRSFIGGFDRAVGLHLLAQSLVDIVFNDFVDNVDDVFSRDADQLLSVQSNTFVKKGDPYGWAVGLFNGYSIFDTKHDRAVIYKNTFSLESAATAIFATGTSNRSVAISANRFGGNIGSNVIVLAGTHRANVTNNAFEGQGLTGVMVGGSENNITGNNFAGFCADEADILLDPGASGSIVGAGQKATTRDLGTGNHLLGEFESPIKSDCENSTISQDKRMLSSTARYRELKSRIAHLLAARHGECERSFPTPVVSFTGTGPGGTGSTHYNLVVDNWQEFEVLFEIEPRLPGCAGDPPSPRTWAYTETSGGGKGHTFCGLSAEWIGTGGIWFAVSPGDPVPTSARIRLHDRLCDKNYYSDWVPIP